MGEDINFVRALMDTYIVTVQPTKQIYLEALREELEHGDYDLDKEERREIIEEIDRELEKLGVKKETEITEEGEKEEEEEQEEAIPERRGEEDVHEHGHEPELEHEPGHEAKLTEIMIAFKTNPDGIADAINEGISPDMKNKIANIIRARLEKAGLTQSLDWQRSVSEYIERCENAGGTVMMRTQYANERFEDRENPGKYLVLMICYSKGWSQWFGNVPREDIEKLESD